MKALVDITEYKMRIGLCGFCALVVLIIGCSRATDQPPSPILTQLKNLTIPRPVKGYELYSWEQDKQLYFTFITGTNRLKNYDEIISDETVVNDKGWVKITVRGIDTLKAVLAKVPQNEEILWHKGEGLAPGQKYKTWTFTFPAQVVVEEIKEYCRQLGIKLQP
jgi:hypothetical protein